MRRPALAAAALAALAAAVPGCAPDPGPEATYRALVRAVAERDADAAWELLSADSRAWLAERARRAAAAAPGVASADPRALLLGDASLGAPPPRVLERVRADGARAALRVEAPGAPPAEVALVREGGRWRVELPRPAADAPSPPGAR